jgi:hypothetical protein
LQPPMRGYDVRVFVMRSRARAGADDKSTLPVAPAAA